MRLVKFSRAGAVMPPGLDEFSIPGKFHNAIIFSVAVSDKNIAVRSDGDSRWLVKPIRARAGDAFLTQNHQYFSRGTQLEHLMAANHAVGILRRNSQHGFVLVGVAGPDIAL